MTRSTSDTSFDDRSCPTRTGAYMRHVPSGRVFYTANPASYQRTLQHRQTYELCTTDEPIKRYWKYGANLDDPLGAWDNPRMSWTW